MSAHSSLSASKKVSPSPSKNLSVSVNDRRRQGSPRTHACSPASAPRLPGDTSASPGSKANLLEKTNFYKSTLPKSQNASWSDMSLLGTSSGIGSDNTLHASDETYRCEDKDRVTPVTVTAISDSAAKLARLLSSKKRDFQRIKRDLIAQQKMVLEKFSSMKELEQKARMMGALAPDEPALGEMKVVDIGCWGGCDIRLLAKDKLSADALASDSALGASVLREVVMRLSAVPRDVSAMSAEHLRHLRTQIEYLSNRYKIDKVGLNLKKRVMELTEEVDKLEAKSESTVTAIRAKLEKVVDMTRIAWVDREALVKRLEKAKQELSEAQRKLEEAPAAGDALPAAAPPRHGEHTSTIENELRAQLARERTVRETMKATVSGAETTLRAARSRIADLEKQAKDTGAELEHWRTKYRELEQQSRHRQSSLEVCSKKMKESSKSAEATIETLTKQREALELRVKELSEQLSLSDSSAVQRLAEAQTRYATLEAHAAARQAELAAAEERLRAAQAQARAAERSRAQLQERCHQLVSFHEQHRAEFLPQPQGGNVSDREVELWKELQSSRLALGRVKEEARKARLDKEQFLHQLAKIAQKEENSVQGRIAGEFIEKERNNFKLQEKINVLEQRERTLELSVSSYETQVANLKMQVKKLQNYTCNTAVRSHEDLHTQVMELQMEVSRLRAERGSAERAAAESQLLLERHERAAALQRQAVRLREKLLSILNRHSDPPSRAALPRQAGSATTVMSESDAAETWSVLQNEHARVKRLEQVVCKQHEQLRRCNGERCRLEQSRSSLERQLSKHQTPKSRFFGEK